MPSLALGDASSSATPLLLTYTGAAGVLADPYALAFTIDDTTDETVAPVQVFPGEGRHTVDLAADKVATGTFAAAWTVPGDAAIGRYRLTWFCTQTEGGREVRWSQAFEVVPLLFGLPGPLYAELADVREEGVTAERASARRVFQALAMASQLVELWTGRSFLPTRKVVTVDGTPADALLFEEPICLLESLLYDGDTVPVDASTYRVYNRHLSQGLVHPDDRDAPKVEYIRRTGALAGDVYPVYPLVNGFNDLASPRRTRAQEVQVAGVFGYTDPDGSPVGRTPLALRKAVVLLALRELPKQGVHTDKAFDARYGGRVTSQRTREQTIAWEARKASDQIAPFTGDPAIDSLLLTYMRPLSGRVV